MYQPNFCAECGERIVRARWRVWTSRRFCQTCARRLRKARVLWPLCACLSLFGLGMCAGRGVRPVSPPPLILERGASTIQTPATNANDADASQTTETKTEPTYGADGTSAERPTDPNEIVSICGARTQKGLPCSRRVRGTGRCWQHKGRSAMLPPEKLIVQ